MTKKFLSKSMLTLALTMSIFTACNNEDEKKTPLLIPTDTKYLHIGYGVGYSGEAEGYILPQSDLSVGNISFLNNGYSLGPSRAHRFYSSSDGTMLYNLEYGNGNLKKIQTVAGSSFYSLVGEKNIADAIGTHPRWRVIDDNTALVYNITTKDSVDIRRNFVKKISIVRLMKIDLAGTMTVSTPVDVVLPDETETIVPNLHIWRIDQPVIHGGKVYIGVAKQGYDPTKTGREATVRTSEYAASTLVLDYPTFANPTIIRSKVGKGQTYGYRAPSYWVAEDGSIYHNSMDDTRIFKITNGKYDDTYDFDLAKALGLEKVGGTGMFYTYNHIAYIPFYEASKGKGSGTKDGKAWWGVARVDLKNKTAVKLDLPENLWLWYYQNAKLDKNGKLHMAINPVGQNGNIYIFDPTNPTSTGFTKGANISISGEGFYMGVF